MNRLKFFGPKRGVAIDDGDHHTVRAVERVAFFAAHEAGLQQVECPFTEDPGPVDRQGFLEGRRGGSRGSRNQLL